MKDEASIHFGGRYWAALLLASFCGTNLGDVLPDLLNFTPLQVAGAWAVLIILGVIAAFVARREAFYWSLFLILCSAGTALADLLVHDAGLGFLVSGAVLLGITAFALVIRQAIGSDGASRISSRLLFWVAFFAVCALGTVLADGIGHAFPSVKIGVPVSTLMATVVLLVSIGTGFRMDWRPGGLFWAALVAARWWGTSAGDIAAFLVGLEVCIGVSAIAFILILLFWRGSHEGPASVVPAREP